MYIYIYIYIYRGTMDLIMYIHFGLARLPNGSYTGMRMFHELHGRCACYTGTLMLMVSQMNINILWLDD